MKSYYKDFCIEGDSLISGNQELYEVIGNRKERCAKTVEYKEFHDKFYKFIDELTKLLPDDRKTIIGLEEAAVRLEIICFETAYLDGMSDLMAAMTFNKLGITMAQYIKRDA